jgi:hypothetical protein
MNRHVKSVAVVPALLLAAGAVGCARESTGPGQQEIVGSWTATKCEYVSTTGLGTVDLIAAGGSATMALNADRTFVYMYSPPTGPPETLTGTWEMTSPDLMRVTPAGASWYWAWDVALSGNTLTLTGAGAEYDFNHDGFGESAKWNLVLTR